MVYVPDWIGIGTGAALGRSTADGLEGQKEAA